MSSVVVRIEIEVVSIALRMYRLCTDPAAEDEFARSFVSNYELQEPPRKVERRATVLHMALSTWADEDRARRLAHRFPQIGTHIAVMRLPPDRGICIAQTGPIGHWSIWGAPDQLRAAVVDVVPLRGQG
jgi:hypothetical protein